MEETTIQQNTYCTFTKKVVIELKIGVRMLDRGISQHSPGRGLNLSRAFNAIWHTEYTLVKLDKQQSLKNKYIYIYILMDDFPIVPTQQNSSRYLILYPIFSHIFPYLPLIDDLLAP